MRQSTTERGKLAENLAADFLRLQGYVVEARNFRASRYEIDIVAGRGELAVLVEVKYRRGSRFGGAAGALTREKKRFLEAAAVGYLTANPKRKLRFDVILVDENPEAGTLTLRHVPGAWRAGPRFADRGWRRT